MKEDLYYFSGRDDVFWLELAGISWCDASYHIRRPASCCWVLEQVMKGRGTLKVDGASYTASAGDIYLLPKGSDHDYFSSAADPWEKIFMNLRGSLPDALFSAYGLTGKVIFTNCQAEGLFWAFYRILQWNAPESERLKACALKLHEICAAIHQKQQAQHAEPPEAAAMKRYLESNLSRLVSIRELAKQIYRSPDYASKLFLQTYGKTPYAYLLEKKMELACRLLESSALSVQEISSRLGYEDAHYFSGLFKSKMGCAPRKWRTERDHQQG